MPRGLECHIDRRCQEKGTGLRAHRPASHGPWSRRLEGQGSVLEAENKGSTTWGQEPGCTGLNSGCVTLDGPAALSGLQFHLKTRGAAERPTFPRLQETSRHRAVPGNGLKSPR